MSTTTTTYADSPAELYKNEVRDYSDKKQVQLYKDATTSLYAESTNRYGLTPSTTNAFIDKVFDTPSNA